MVLLIAATLQIQYRTPCDSVNARAPAP